jgi:hypothetical protein
MDFLTFRDLKADRVYSHLTKGKPVTRHPQVREFK